MVKQEFKIKKKNKEFEEMLVQETNEDMFFIVENVMHIGQNQFHFVLLFTTICHRHQMKNYTQSLARKKRRIEKKIEEIMLQNITSSSAQHKIV